ncbi:MAG: SpoIIE family protein phosphatase [Ignavibacteriales bacterium]|nr:SpoIIE family protein phosphatase [Ignavibacteriales bacterium]
MNFRKIFYASGAALLLIVVFIMDAAMKNIDETGNGLMALRAGMMVASLSLMYLTVSQGKKREQHNIVQRIGRVAMFTGAFVGLYIVVSVLPLDGFQSRELRLIPIDYITILCATILSAAAGVLSILTIVNIREVLLFKRKRGTKRNFWLLIAAFLGAAASTYNLRPLESSNYREVLLFLAVGMIIVNSFRLSWIAYLTRREKIYTMLYSLLAFFAFMAIYVIMSEKEFLLKSLRYFSYPLQTVFQETALFGAIFFGMAFISTMFHLPTAEAFDRKRSEIVSFHSLSRLITQVFDFNDLAESVTRMTLEVCGASGAWLEILPSDIVSSRNISRDDIARIVEGSPNTVRSTVLASKTVLLVDDVANDRRTKYFAGIHKVASIAVVPLMTHDELIGILYVTKEMDHAFDQDDIEVLTGFADQVSIAIDNARLIKKSLEKERLQRELLLAQEMQKRLLPQTLPVFKNLDMKAVSAPALEVGGDYYDIIRLDENMISFVIGDVSGKGVGAAFYMAEVKGIFQSLSRIYPSPKEFLIKANEALITSIDKRSFISLMYSTLNVVTGEMHMARAGHCPMLLLSGGRAEFVKPAGMGLGLAGNHVFAGTVEEISLTLHKDDVCVFYTDGVTESRSAAGEEFGYDRLVSVVRDTSNRCAEDIKEEIIQRVWAYTDAQGYDDDLTVMVLKWNGPH